MSNMNINDTGENIEDSELFVTHYKKLDGAVSMLETMSIENIDRLVPVVESAAASFKACMARLNAIQEHLGITIAE